MATNTRSSITPHGVLPDEVIADPNSQGLIAFIAADPNTAPASIQAFLKELTAVLRSLEQPDDGGRVNFSACLGFGPSFFFTASGSPRFGLGQDGAPLGFRQLPTMTAQDGNLASIASDIVIYAMSRREALIADLLAFLARSKGVLSAVRIERGYQRDDHREAFGFLDGLRNIPKPDRSTVITTTEDVEPDGPVWTIGGTYMTYMKILQNVSASAQLGTSSMENAIGRRQVDGSRQDQPGRMSPRTEPDFDPDSITPAVSSHVRKAGPRTIDQRTANDVFVFRRGIPFTNLTDGDLLETGLHFVGFARSLDYINIVWNHWIMNRDFPKPDAGIDELFRNNLMNVTGVAFFFVPPEDDRFFGASIFLGPERPQEGHAAKVIIRKTILDQNGQPTLKALNGFGFRLLHATSNPVAEEFFTNSAGHATSPELPVNQPLTLRETTNPLAEKGLQSQADVPIAPISTGQPPTVIVCTNRFPAPPPPGYR